jgi:hypothetical protein
MKPTKGNHMNIPQYELERINEFINHVEEVLETEGYAYAYGATMFNLKYLINMINHNTEMENA